MKHFWKRLIAGVLTLVILAGTLPVPAWAALVDNTPDQNDEILRELTAFWGDEKTAQEATDLLREYGLIDEEGNVLTDWSGEIYIHDGDEPRHTSVEELTALLEDETVSRDTVITVDGTEITLGGFETILEIQREIGRIRETYLQDEVPLNQEQAASLYSLYEQLSENGIQLYSTNGADELVFPSGVDHSVIASIEGANTAVANKDYTFTVKLSKPQSQDVTFSYVVYSGSAKVSGSGTGTIEKGQTSTDVTVTVQGGQGKTNGTGAFSVLVYDLKNAFFPDGTTAASKLVKVDEQYNFVYQWTQDFNLSWTPDKYHDNYQFLSDNAGNPMNNDSGNAALKELSEKKECAVLATKQVEFTGLPNSTYEAAIQIIQVELMRDKISGISQNDEVNFKVGNNVSLNMSPSFTYDWGKNADFATITYKMGDYCNVPATGGKLSLQASYGSLVWRTDFAGFGYSGRQYYYPKLNSCDAKLYVRDATRSATVELSAPSNKFYFGQQVLVIAHFSFPMKITENMTLTLNDQTMTPVEVGATSDYCTFLYTVQKMDQAELHYENAVLNGTGANGKEITVTVDSSRLANATIVTPVLLDAVNSTPTVNAGQVTYTPAQGDQPEKTTATVTVTLDMPTDTNLRNLIGGSYAVDGGFASSVLAGSIDGGGTLIPLMLDNSSDPTKLTATVELDAKTLMDQQDFVMEFYTIDGTTHESTGLLFGRYAAFSVNKPVPLKREHLSIQKPAGWPEGPIYVNNPPEEAALTLRAVVNAPAGTTWTQTRWVSSNEKVATIDTNGRVYPLGTGTVEFCLEAVNGNLAEYAGERSQSVSLTIQQGAEPYLRIPENEMTIRSGDPVTVRWASNLVQKNMEYGGANTPTSFTITVTGPNGQPVGDPYVVTYDPADQSDPALWADGSPNQSFTINGLTDTDAKGYTVTISASADAKVPGTNRDFTAQAKVTVVSQPVSVRLTRPTSLFQTNTGTLTVNYTLDNYDSQNSAEFKLVVTDNATGQPVPVTDNATGQSVRVIEAPHSDTGGSFTIDLAGASIPDGFRTIYDVSLQAKNTAEKDWSRDSFTLYIYDKNCLDILVQPVTKDGVTTVDVDVDGDKVTMSNEAWIASLTQDRILALNRDIDLQAAISINYGAHAWGEASDRIQWASENSKIAAVNYPQGAYYENIEGLPYTSYAPATQFLLSGRNNGQTVVEAIHALAGDALSSSVEVTVETLKDKLYLFQVYPVGEATLTYTNGDGVTKSHNTDENGRAAVYEASGIASDIYVEATIGGEKYLGTVYKSALVSQEKDAVSLELYPLNSLNLRKAASLPVYLKKPDGTNYSGAVKVRAGVYRNGVYCAAAKYSTTAGSATIDGGEENKVTFTGGKATFYYDLTQFNTNNNADPVTAADDIQFVLELQADGYYPVLFTVNGTTNEDDAIRLSERIVNLEAVPAGQENQPFVARQTVYFSGKESGAAADVRNQTGKAGPSADYPDLLLSTTVFWWGQPNDQNSRSIQYVDGAGVVLTGQEQVAGSYYPFCSMPVSHSTVHLDQTQMDHLSMGDLTIRSLTLHYLDADGTAVKKETMRWQMMNALHMPKAGESNDLMASMDALMDIMQTEGGMSNVGSGF